PPPTSFPYTTLFRSDACRRLDFVLLLAHHRFDAGAKPPAAPGQAHDCRRQKLSPAIVETGSTAAFGFDSRSKRCETLHSDSRQSYEDHLRRLRPINDIFPFGSVTPVRFLDPRKQAAGFGECLEPGA